MLYCVYMCLHLYHKIIHNKNSIISLLKVQHHRQPLWKISVATLHRNSLWLLLERVDLCSVSQLLTRCWNTSNTCAVNRYLRKKSYFLKFEMLHQLKVLAASTWWLDFDSPECTRYKEWTESTEESYDLSICSSVHRPIHKHNTHTQQLINKLQIDM